MSLFNERGAKKWPTSFRMKSELDRYLEDELVPLSKDKFSVLDWWKVSGTRYPTLRLLARDIFQLRSTRFPQNQHSSQVVEF